MWWGCIINTCFQPTAIDYHSISKATYRFIQFFVASTHLLVGAPNIPISTVWLRIWDAGDGDQAFMWVVGL